MKKFLVETVVTYRMRYVIEAEDESHAETQILNRIRTGEIKEFSQKALGEEVFSTRKIKHKEYIKLFDIDNDYLKQWPESMKYEMINRINTEDYSKEW